MSTIADLMSRNVVTASPRDSLSFADAIMRERGVRHVPIVDGGKLVGLVTHRDLLRAQGEVLAKLVPSDDETFASTSLGDLMTRDVATVSPDTELAEALSTMLSKKLGCMPVLAGGKLVGIVTQVDFLRWTLELVRGQ